MQANDNQDSYSITGTVARRKGKFPHYNYPPILDMIYAPRSEQENKLVDLGCGLAEVARVARDRGWKVTTVDNSEMMVNYAESLGFESILADLSKPIPIDDDSFDFCLAVDVAQYIPHCEGFFSEITRIVKPEGLILFGTENYASLSSRLRHLWGLPPRNEGRQIRSFTKSTLFRLFEQQRWRLVRRNCYNRDFPFLRPVPFFMESWFAKKLIYLLQNMKNLDDEEDLD